MRRPYAGADRRAGGIRTPQGGSPFSPASLLPTLWQRPQDIAATGTDIDSWANGGGSVGGSFTGAGAARPQTTTVGGLAAADFVAASSDQINSAGMSVSNVLGTSSGWTAFIVMHPDAVSAVNPTVYANEGWLCSVGGNLWGIFTRRVLGVPHVSAYQWDGAVRVAEAPVTVGATQLLQARWAGAGNPIKLRVGAAAEVTSASANNITSGADTLREGRAGAAGGTFADGQLAEPMAWNRYLSDAECALVRSYYAARYGVSV